MATSLRWTIQDLILFPENDGKRYEIIDGELYVSTQPDWRHQFVCSEIAGLLNRWSEQGNRGLAMGAPGVIFAVDDAVAPDLVWVRRERFGAVLSDDGKLHAAPDLVVEVLSPGARNVRRDREAKLGLYSVRGVHEYWIVDWRQQQIDVYRRQEAQLHLVGTLFVQGVLRSPLLPGFALPLERLFARIPVVTPITGDAASEEPV